MKKRKVAAAVPYEPGLLDDLKDPKFAARYLTDCLTDSIYTEDEPFEMFFTALFEVLKAHNITVVAKDAKISRDALYKAFKEHQNPTVKTFRRILNSVDLDMKIVPLQK